MKHNFEYDLTKFDPTAETRSEKFVTASGIKTLKTDAHDGAVILENSVDPNSLNPVTSAAVAAAVAGASGEVPVIGDSDDGKVLTASVSGSTKSASWEPLPSVSEVPAVGDSDDGKVLMATYTPAHDDVPASSGFSWATIPSQLPAYDPVEDIGKVLKITADGLAWVALT